MDPDERQLYEAEALLYARWAEDPLRTFIPTPRQRPFIEAVLRGMPPTVLFGAGNRSGKTIAAAYCGDARALRHGRAARGVVERRIPQRVGSRDGGVGGVPRLRRRSRCRPA